MLQSTSPNSVEPSTGEQSHSLSSLTKDNLAALAEIAEREESRVSGVQLAIERVSSFVGSPGYFVGVVVFIVGWLAVNTWAAYAEWQWYDEPPFFWLQGIVSANALLLTVAVLIRQNRMSRLAQHRAHLDLQINLLTEQKVSKVLQVLDDMRRESPLHNTPIDGEVAEHVKPADVTAIHEAIKEHGMEQSGRHAS